MLFHVVNLGCKVNKVESDSYAAQCLSAGLAEGSLEAADLIVINTCAVTGEAEKKTRKTVRHVCNKNNHAKVLSLVVLQHFMPIFIRGCRPASSF